MCQWRQEAWDLADTDGEDRMERGIPRIKEQADVMRIRDHGRPGSVTRKAEIRLAGEAPFRRRLLPSEIEVGPGRPLKPADAMNTVAVDTTRPAVDHRFDHFHTDVRRIGAGVHSKCFTPAGLSGARLVALNAHEVALGRQHGCSGGPVTLMARCTVFGELARLEVLAEINGRGHRGDQDNRRRSSPQE